VGTGRQKVTSAQTGSLVQQPIPPIFLLNMKINIKMCNKRINYKIMKIVSVVGAFERSLPIMKLNKKMISNLSSEIQSVKGNR
jgi:excinuclease UvrABC helicase subunit UvrB